MKVAGVSVTGLGMHSALGGATQACAAARAGITRAAELELAVCTGDEVAPVNVVGHPCQDAVAFQGLGRLALLASSGLDDLAENVQLPDSSRRRVHVVLNIPDPSARPLLGDQLRELEKPVNVTALGEALTAILRPFLPRALASAQVALHGDGHAGVIAGVELAVDMLLNGRSDCCVVGGVDSYIDLESLEWLAGTDRLKTPARPTGLVPGEGAAFVVLERTEEAARRGAIPLATLASVALDEVDYDFDGEGLTPHGRELVNAIAVALGDAGGRRDVGLLVQDRNGTNARAMEWGYVLQACAAQNIPLGDSTPLLPAMSFGDLGAAWSAFAICLGTRIPLRTQRVGSVLIASSSEDGLRGALVLAT